MKLKPSKAYYYFGVGIIFTSIILFVILLIGSIKILDDSNERFLVPGSKELYLADTGEYYIFYELRSKFNNINYEVDASNLSHMYISVYNIDKSEYINLNYDIISLSYNGLKSQGVGAFKFDLDSPANIKIEGKYKNYVGDEFVIRVDDNFVMKFIIRMWIQVVVLIIGIAVGGITILITAIKRNNYRRDQFIKDKEAKVTNVI